MKINKFGKIEIELGEVIKSADDRCSIKAVEKDLKDCYNCAFWESDSCWFACCSYEREDEKDVIFEKVD